MRVASVLYAGFVAAASCQFDPYGAADDGGADSVADATLPIVPDASPGLDAAIADADVGRDATKGCPEAYVADPSTGSSYRVVLEAIAWQPAEKACEAEGTHLVQIDDDHEHAQVVGLAGKHVGADIDKIWLGLDDRKSENLWRFVTGEAASEAQLYWNPGEPSGNADCAAFYRLNDSLPDDGGRYDDVSCSDTQRIAGYVCECDGRAALPSSYE
jgi:hypothetical protein